VTTDRYQSSATEPGAMPTLDWFAALLAGIHGPLGTVLDVGSAEGVMSMAAADAGADPDPLVDAVERHAPRAAGVRPDLVEQVAVVVGGADRGREQAP